MWIKKDKIKNNIMPEKFKLYFPPFILLYLFTSSEMLKSQYSRNWGKGGFFGKEYTWGEYFNSIYIPILISIIPPFLLFIKNLIKYKKGYLKYDIVSGICDNCNKCMNNVLEHTKCKCGGEVISYKHMIWIDDLKDRK